MRARTTATEKRPGKLPPRTRLAIVRSAWYPEVVDPMEEGARKVFAEAGVKESGIATIAVPGSFEIPLACMRLLETRRADGILALGIIVQGETHHAKLIAGACTRGLMHVQLQHGVPIADAVLFVRNMPQARRRSRGRNNRGSEGARSLVAMVQLCRRGRRMR